MSSDLWWKVGSFANGRYKNIATLNFKDTEKIKYNCVGSITISQLTRQALRCSKLNRCLALVNKKKQTVERTRPTKTVSSSTWQLCKTRKHLQSKEHTIEM